MNGKVNKEVQGRTDESALWRFEHIRNREYSMGSGVREETWECTGSRQAN